MPTPLDTLLEQFEPDILDRWQQRIAATGLLSDDARGEPLRDRLRRLLADLRATTCPGQAPRGPAPLPLRLRKDEAGSVLRGTVRSETLLALALGRDVVEEVLHERLPRAEAAACAAPLADAFQRLFSLHGATACARCMAEQDESRVRIERRLATVVEHSRDAILSYDAAQGVVGWNRGAEHLFGYSAEEMQGDRLDRLVPAEADANAWVEELTRRVRAEGHVRLNELELVTRAGARVWVDASINRMRGPEGEELGLWAVFRDITEQRRLVQENLDAERLALIGTMSAKFAHEIRNPLASILLNVELIRDSLAGRAPATDGVPNDDDELVGAIASEVGRIRNVVQEYLRFGRLPTIQRSAIDLDELLGRNLAGMAPEFKSRSIALALDLAAPGRLVAADADQLWQVVLNLIVNAMEALPPGGRISISTQVDTDGVRCTVADDGPGIPREIQERIFQPFFSTKRSGTGLGLPFARQVLAEHGATLALASTPGAGTRFSFVLPHARGEAP
jgi:PAS domain S-box-containing protein